MKRSGSLLLQFFLAAAALGVPGWPRDSCPRCVRLLEEPLISVPSYNVPAPEKKGRLRAGAARVDITPPPGFPLGGDGFAGGFGRGYWTRLYARAFFFRDADGQTLALVSCDLNAMAGGLQAKVAHLVKDDGVNLTRENLVITATHTHQGPGNFMSNKVYNDEGSTEQGFDRKLFCWLAEKIASAVKAAALDADGSPEDSRTELWFRQGAVSDLLRNRAPGPFLLNPDREDVVKEGPPVPGFCPEPFPDYCPRYRAVDNTLSLLEIERTSGAGTTTLVGTLVFLSVHPESMSEATALYQSDFTGLAMRRLELKDPDRKLVAGFFNGAEGDISVRWERQNRNEAVRFAELLVKFIEQTRMTGTSLGAETRVQVAQTVVKPNPYFTGPGGSFQPLAWCYEKDRSLCLGNEPRFGVATPGGAEDARTPMYDLGWKAGVRWPAPRDHQGVKQGAFESRMLPMIDMTGMIAVSCFYPDSFPLSVVRLQGKESVTFGAIPGEMTRTAWRRIRRTLEKMSGVGHVLPLGLANDHIFYLPTKEEYAAQAYEGASDIFGPSTAEVIRRSLEEIAGKLHPPIPGKTAAVATAEYYPDWRSRSDFSLFGLFSSPMRPFDATGTESFGPEWLGVAYPDPDEGLENLIVDRQDIPYRHWPRFSWWEKNVNDWDGSGRTVQVLADSKEVKGDDQGADMLTVYRNPPPPPDEKMPKDSNSPQGRMRRFVRPVKKKPADGGRHWMAVWLSADQSIQDLDLYFSVTINDNPNGKGTTICSVKFKLRDVWAAEKPDVTRAESCP